MDIKLFLVKSITLMYQESQLTAIEQGKSNTVKPLIEESLKYIRLPDSEADDGLERNVLVHLRTTLFYLLQQPANEQIDQIDLLQRLKLNLRGDDSTYTALTTSIIEYGESDVEKLRRAIQTGKRNLQGFTSKEKAKQVLRQAHKKISFNSSSITDLDDFVKETMSELSGIDMGATDARSDPAFVGSVDFNDRGSVHKAFAEMKAVLSTAGVIRMPWKAMNDMFSDNQGVRRGETHLWNALPHNYKSGLLTDAFLGASLFNKPFLFDEKKKPAIVLFSTEDDLSIIMQKFYRILKQRETNYTAAIITRTIPEDEMTDYVMTTLRATGWNVFVHRVRPSMFTVHKYISTMEQYKADGYEVAMVVCDYLAMFSKAGRRAENKGDDIQDLFRATREYNAAELIAFITAHQLSTDAKREKRVNPDNFLQQLPGKGYYEGCSKIDTEVDFEGYTNKRTVVNGAFQEFLWGKHRGVVPDESKKYFVLKYLPAPLYGIQYDVDLEENLSYKVVGGKPNSEGGGREWFDLDDAA